MIEVFLTRHGQTVWNTQVRMQGRSNSPLTEEGIVGAMRLTDVLSEIPFTACFTSPMPRAVHTALLLLRGRETPLLLSPLLAEMDLGTWEGLSMQEASSLYPENFRNFRERPDLYEPVGGGETFFSVCDRAKAMLREIASRPDGSGPFLLVTHCILLQAIVMLCDQREMPTLRSGQAVDQTTLFRIVWDGQSWSVTHRNLKPENVSDMSKTKNR